jgi:hypothetical protein
VGQVRHVASAGRRRSSSARLRFPRSAPS